VAVRAAELGDGEDGVKLPTKFAATVWSVGATLPIATKSANNLHELPFARHRRVKAERAEVGTWLMVLFGRHPPLAVAQGGRIVVTLTRLGGRGLDSDNLAGAYKAIRDGVADWLGIDDGDDRIEWRYAQEPGGAKGTRVLVEGG
jgi:hypothetical protein